MNNEILSSNCLLQNPVVSREDGYPNPLPSSHLNGTLLRKQHWFTDDKFNNASDDADLFKAEIAVDDDDIDLDTLSDEVVDDLKLKRVQASASVKDALSYDDIDNHAKKVKQKVKSQKTSFSFVKQIQYFQLTAVMNN